MKKIICVGLLAIMSGVASAQKQPPPPNIIFFLVDDMGWQDCSVPFWNDTTDANRRFHTPAMQRLANEGLLFQQAYSHSVCTPSRVSLLTGMSPARHRVTNWTMNKNQPTDAADYAQLSAPNWNVNGLTTDSALERAVYATPLPALLKQAGYYTIMCGKAHFGADKTPGADPLNLGFVKNIGGSAAGNPASFLAEKNYGNKPGEYSLRGIAGLEKYWGTQTFLTEALTQEAMLAMDTARQQHQPFFLYMSHYAVHLPFDADNRFIDKYSHLTKEEGAYAALVEGMDKSLGDLMDYLEKHQLHQNTIIIFTSDNGGYTLAPRMGTPNTQNAPLRAGKGSLFEGGIRVPLLVKWPGTTGKQLRSNYVVAIQDFFPTLLQMAQVEAASLLQPVDGKTIVPALRNPGKTNPQRRLLWHYPNKWLRDAGNQSDLHTSFTSALRKGNWKIIFYYRNRQAALYNVKNDISEKNDLSATQPAKKRRMLRLLTCELQAHRAQLPIDKTTGNMVEYPK